MTTDQAAAVPGDRVDRVGFLGCVEIRFAEIGCTGHAVPLSSLRIAPPPLRSDTAQHHWPGSNDLNGIFMRYLVRDRMLAFHEEAWIETEHREKLYKVDRKLLRLRRTFDFVDTRGNQVASIVKKALTFHHTILIKRNGALEARFSKRAFTLFGDRFKVTLQDGRRLRIDGNVWDREFDIQHDGTTLAHISRRWFSIRDGYAIDVMAEEDPTLLVILAVCVDHTLEDLKGEKLTNL